MKRLEGMRLRQALLKLAKQGWQFDCRGVGVDPLVKELGLTLDDTSRKLVNEEVRHLKKQGKIKAVYGDRNGPSVGQPTPSRLIYFGPVWARGPRYLLNAFSASAVRTSRRTVRA